MQRLNRDAGHCRIDHDGGDHWLGEVRPAADVVGPDDAERNHRVQRRIGEQLVYIPASLLDEPVAEELLVAGERDFKPGARQTGGLILHGGAQRDIGRRIAVKNAADSYGWFLG